jgi:hypothetical protein
MTDMHSSEIIDVPYATIFESELRALAGISARWGNLETGAEFFGAWSNHGLPIIQLAVGPGPKAVHQSCHYEQDLEFFRRIHDIIVSEYGIAWICGGHGHHTLGLRAPSSDDVRTVMGVTKRNGLERWCEIITTFEGPTSHHRMDERIVEFQTETDDSLRIRVDAYLYTDPQRGQKVSIPIRVLPGVSPIRKAVLASGRPSPYDIGEYAVHFPLERILFEAFGGETPNSDPAEEVFAVIAAQCRELPEEAQEGISFTVSDYSVVVALPLVSRLVAHVEYGRKPPNKITAVRLVRDHGTVDDTTMDSLDPRRVETLSQVYRLLRSPLGDGIGGGRSWNRMRALFQAATHAAAACIGRMRHKQ